MGVIIIIMEVLICHPQITGEGHDLSAHIDGTRWVAGHTIVTVYPRDKAAETQ